MTFNSTGGPCHGATLATLQAQSRHGDRLVRGRLNAAVLCQAERSRQSRPLFDDPSLCGAGGVWVVGPIESRAFCEELNVTPTIGRGCRSARTRRGWPREANRPSAPALTERLFNSVISPAAFSSYVEPGELDVAPTLRAFPGIERLADIIVGARRSASSRLEGHESSAYDGRCGSIGRKDQAFDARYPEYGSITRCRLFSVRIAVRFQPVGRVQLIVGFKRMRRLSRVPFRIEQDCGS